MHSDHLLGHLAQRFTASEENLATEALTWILGRSSIARTAMSQMLRPCGAELPDLTFLGQVGNPDTGRPDIIGTDEDGAERLIVEAKFGAHLTANQPVGYLRRLATDLPGALLVVAPSSRLTSLWIELGAAMPELEISHSPSTDLPLGPTAARANECHVIAIVSWRDAVTSIRDALRTGGEFDLAQDAEQLLALTEAMDSAEYLPVRPGDYGARAAKLVNQLTGLIDGARDLARSGSLLERNGNSSHGRIFYGWYLRAKMSRKSIWFGFLPRAWDRHGISPLWMQVSFSDGWSRQRLRGALRTLDRADGPGLFDSQNSLLIPLLIPIYSSQKEAIASLARQLEDVAGLLDAALAAGENPLPDEPDDASDEAGLLRD